MSTNQLMVAILLAIVCFMAQSTPIKTHHNDKGQVKPPANGTGHFNINLKPVSLRNSLNTRNKNYGRLILEYGNAIIKRVKEKEMNIYNLFVASQNANY
ncbi:hypothetical protein BLOT_016012 [Blomia tropicalis]|nr:hypothetical protein BLOT_016012 [Blomia tropicalis]